MNDRGVIKSGNARPAPGTATRVRTAAFPRRSITPGSACSSYRALSVPSMDFSPPPSSGGSNRCRSDVRLIGGNIRRERRRTTCLATPESRTDAVAGHGQRAHGVSTDQRVGLFLRCGRDSGEIRQRDLWRCAMPRSARPRSGRRRSVLLRSARGCSHCIRKPSRGGHPCLGCPATLGALARFRAA